MCEGCWVEMGSPQIVTDKTKRVAELVGQLYAMPGGGVGGNLHIVTDDWNLEDEHIAYCAETVATPDRAYRYDDPAQLAVEAEICALMKDMTEAERGSALAIEGGYFEMPN